MLRRVFPALHELSKTGLGMKVGLQLPEHWNNLLMQSIGNLDVLCIVHCIMSYVLCNFEALAATTSAVPKLTATSPLPVLDKPQPRP